MFASELYMVTPPKLKLGMSTNPLLVPLAQSTMNEVSTQAPKHLVFYRASPARFSPSMRLSVKCSSLQEPVRFMRRSFAVRYRRGNAAYARRTSHSRSDLQAIQPFR